MGVERVWLINRLEGLNIEAIKLLIEMNFLSNLKKINPKKFHGSFLIINGGEYPMITNDNYNA